MSRRVLFDGYWLGDGPPSGRNVVAGLIEGWTRAFPEDVVDVAYPANRAPVRLPEGVGAKPARTRIPSQGAWAALRIGGVAADYDVVLTQNFTPFTSTGGALRATFLHDAMYREHPEWFTRGERMYLALASAGLRSADVILTSSDAERARIGRIFPGSAERTHAVGLAVPVGLAAARSDETVPTERPFILAVGRLNVRKNLARLIEAYELAGLSSSHDLRVVGSPDGVFDALPGGDTISFTGSISDARLAELYSSCAFFVFPSLDEGFGLPLVEAAHFGAPSAASDISSFREIGVADVYFDPTDPARIASALDTMARRHARRVRDQQVHPAALSWESTARRARSAIFQQRST